jgi:hypothetical protein
MLVSFKSSATHRKLRQGRGRRHRASACEGRKGVQERDMGCWLRYRAVYPCL